MHLSRKQGFETIPRPLFDRSCTSFDLQEGLNKGPQSDPETLASAQNTVNNGVFQWFHYFSFLFCISWHQDEMLNRYGSKQAL